MKYIRTEGDKIIGYDENSSELDKPTILHYPNKIVKEADAIWKLCNKFVFETLNGMEIRTSYTECKAYISRYKKVYPSFIKKAYGAIWTAKGLIYVAKMSEKGEFELL